MVLEKRFILLFLLFLVMAVILDSWLDPVLQFWNLESDHASCEIWQQLVQRF